MPVPKTTPRRLRARVIAPIRVAFRQRNDVGTRDEGTFAAQWLANALPCQRFADALARICACITVDAVRYSFIVMHLHHLLPLITDVRCGDQQVRKVPTDQRGQIAKSPVDC